MWTGLAAFCSESISLNSLKRPKHTWDLPLIPASSIPALRGTKKVPWALFDPYFCALKCLPLTCIPMKNGNGISTYDSFFI